MKNMLKKGISPLLASVLLIAFTVALGTIIFSFMQTTVRSTTATVSNKTAESVNCGTAGISVQDVYIVGTTNATVNVIVKNNGLTNDLQIQDAVLFNSTGHNYSSSSIPVADFDKGEITTLTFSRVTIGSCPASFSKVIVSTSCGGISDTFDGTPKCV